MLTSSGSTSTPNSSSNWETSITNANESMPRSRARCESRVTFTFLNAAGAAWAMIFITRSSKFAIATASSSLAQVVGRRLDLDRPDVLREIVLDLLAIELQVRPEQAVFARELGVREHHLAD